MKLTNAEPMLIARGLDKTYGTRGNTQQVLKGLDFDVIKGEFVGVMGPSGSGKTTLLNVLATIDKTTGGTIQINKHDISKLKDRELSDVRRKELGFIFQDYNLLDTLTVKENILLPISLGKLSERDAEQAFQNLASILGITELASKYPVEISGGQKQRTAVARALIHEPAIVFADEPTGALDSKAASLLLENLKTLNEKQSATIVMVTHDPVASSYCNRVVFLKDGKIYSELYRGEKTREVFFKEIMDVQAVLGGGGQS
ncbi:bacitracin transport system ATP-binding protein [Amphibacillus marinus]|uniref:Bacitracin transport system ATP-binding protein n=1 Tax=Amphibacillus marinus TaxID=872970 RepID=A0A1H8KHP6_9BACI|nr:ABC transporter ATP-binding protein [Amphibacillus marinus]SEN92395.1 bacitracin transport system ATP-binding protein [Amphibacillus marinus]